MNLALEYVNITWLKNNQPLSASDVTYTILNYTSEHAGIYQCKVQLLDTTVTSPGLIISTNEDVPHIAGGPVSIPNGTIIRLSCASPNPIHNNFRWMKNGKSVKNSRGTKSRLDFKPFQHGDEGAYVCESSKNGEYYRKSSVPRELMIVDYFTTCKCPCPARILNISMTSKELDGRVKEIEKNLTVDYTSLSSWIRKRKSIYSASRFVDYARVWCIIFYCLFFGTIFLLDGIDAVLFIYRKIYIVGAVI